MHIEIKADCRRGLRIIEEIPDLKPGKLEGYNGIGKTSAIRLLQLCTGEQPFRGKGAAWRSFRDQLIEAKVRISDLRDADNIEWTLRPAEWPEDESQYPASSLGEIRIDGRRGTVADVQSLLKIHHLNTTETPVGILTGQVYSASSALETWYRAEGEIRGIAIDNMLSKALKLLATSSPAKIRLAREVSGEAKVALAAAAERVENARTRVQSLSEAVEIADQLDTVRGSSPQMEHKLQELEATLSELDGRRETLDREIEASQIEKHLGEQAEEDLIRLERLVSRYDGALRRRIQELEHAAAAAKVSPRADDVAVAIGMVERELSELINVQPIVSRGPQTLAVLDDLIRRLDDAISAGLSDQILIEEASSSQGWSVEVLREAFRIQMQRISEHAQTSDAEELARNIAAARSRLDALARVESLLETVSRDESRLRNAESRLIETATNLPGSVGRHLNELLRHRNDLDNEGRQLQSQIDRLRAEIDLLGGGRTEEVLAAEFDRLCREVNVDPTRVRSALERERNILNSLTVDHAMVQADEASAAHDLQDMLDAVAKTASGISTSEDLAWLRRAFPQAARLAELSLDEQLATIQSLEARLTDKRQTASETLQTVRSVGVALEQLANGLRDANSSDGGERRRRGPSDSIETQVWDLPVKNWIAGQARQWFDDETMRQALFDGGNDITVDPQELTVSWKLNGEDFKRPLALFSSGEQAFAFTRARVAQLDRDADQVPNRLIALDEFGAFLDAERLSGLSDYLVKRQERIPNDHVLVILPCGVRPRDIVANEEKQTPRDAQLSRRGYFAERLQT